MTATIRITVHPAEHRYGKLVASILYATASEHDVETIDDLDALADEAARDYGRPCAVHVVCTGGRSPRGMHAAAERIAAVFRNPPSAAVTAPVQCVPLWARVAGESEAA